MRGHAVCFDPLPQLSGLLRNAMQLVTFHHSRHVTVMVNGQFYVIDGLTDNGQRLICVTSGLNMLCPIPIPIPIPLRRAQRKQ